MNLEYVRDTINCIPEGVSHHVANNGRTRVTIRRNVDEPSRREVENTANLAALMKILDDNRRRRRYGNRD